MHKNTVWKLNSTKFVNIKKNNDELKRDQSGSIAVSKIFILILLNYSSMWSNT